MTLEKHRGGAIEMEGGEGCNDEGVRNEVVKEVVESSMKGG